VKLSIVIPAHNEQENLGPCLDELILALDEECIPFEIIVVNDNSTDQTESKVLERARIRPEVRLLRRLPPGGFGRAVRTGLEFVEGDCVVIYMADRSDHPQDAIRYFRLLEEGYDCVFGSRFVRGSVVHRYPPLKLIVNRIVNVCIQWMFWTKFNDLTNAFKGFRTDVVRRCGPYRSCHFNITLEISLSALISGYKICQIPIAWEGRTWGSSNLRMQVMGRRYLCTLLMLFFQRILLSDDVQSERTRERKLGVEVDIDRSISEE
jgi:dolichol-phosphate mannosyltransferase